jgi:UTP--glucose-1-phosphate uridylyltransferase
MGTRFLPVTKAVPKELLPIGDVPALQLVIDEALGAGIDHIVMVSSRTKPAIESYFEPTPSWSSRSRQGQGRRRRADPRAIGRDWRVSVVYQDSPRGPRPRRRMRA